MEKEKKNRFGKRPVLTLVIVNIVFLVVLLLLFEFGARLLGSKTIHQENFKEITKAHELFCEKYAKGEIKNRDIFFTDQDGIFKSRPSPQGKRINADGFRSREFEYVETDRTKILVVGDSYAWGASARPITNAFPDLLDNAGYIVYNSGIPGVDAVQYETIAKKYIPLLKPDVTAVTLYMGNDINNKPFIYMPGKNLYYSTNVVWLLGYDDNGIYFDDYEEALSYYGRKRCGKCSGLLDCFYYNTILGKHLYNLFSRKNTEWLKRDRYDNQWVIDTLKRIKALCQKHHSRFFLFIIPVRPDITFNQTDKYIHIFRDFKCYYPKDLTLDDHMKGSNSHFNNIGHKKYFEYMKKILTENGFPPIKDITQNVNK